jgi:hypothetical protein
MYLPNARGIFLLPSRYAGVNGPGRFQTPPLEHNGPSGRLRIEIVQKEEVAVA